MKKKHDQTKGLFDKHKLHILSNICVGGTDDTTTADSTTTATEGGGPVDKSPKGSVDELCLPIMHILNAHNDYVTTSSCSGRIAVWCGVEKGDGGWLLSSHDPVKPEDVCASLDPFPATGNVMFKMEPFVMHVLCRDVEAAHRLVIASLAAGYRNSGAIPGKKKVMVA
eukprot:PhF_6_TR12242/c0_g1_i2/m.19381/K15450/TYW3; tRNA wybutosine-synthesizing protein 3